LGIHAIRAKGKGHMKGQKGRKLGVVFAVGA
jgi:hypothetical protein